MIVMGGQSDRLGVCLPGHQRIISNFLFSVSINQ
jgi:hypothetical protein